jgi:hypothetical protein
MRRRPSTGQQIGDLSPTSAPSSARSLTNRRQRIDSPARDLSGGRRIAGDLRFGQVELHLLLEEREVRAKQLLAL